MNAIQPVLERCSKAYVEEIAKQCGCTLKADCTYWVLCEPKDGNIAFAAVSPDAVLLTFGVRPDMRGRGYARALMDILVTRYSKMSADIMSGGPAESVLLGSGFVHSGNNIMTYPGE